MTNSDAFPTDDVHTDSPAVPSSDDATERESVSGIDPDMTVPGDSDTAGSNAQGADDRYVDGELGGGAIGGAVSHEASTGPAGTAADLEQAAAGAKPNDEVDDGMGPDAPDDVAGEDEAVPGLDDDPLAEAHES